MENDEANFIQDMANNAIARGAQVTIIQNVKQESPMKPVTDMMAAVAINQSAMMNGIGFSMAMKMIGGGDMIPGNSLALPGESKLLIANDSNIDNLRNVNEKFEYRSISVKSCIDECDEEIIIPIVTLKRSTDWKHIVYNECNLHSDDPVIICLTYGEHNEKKQYTMYTSSQHMLHEIAEKYHLGTIVAKAGMTPMVHKLQYIVEPDYTENESIVFDTNTDVPEIEKFFTIYHDKPEFCYINPVEFWKYNAETALWD